jgi:hypothetical protein
MLRLQPIIMNGAPEEFQDILDFQEQEVIKIFGDAKTRRYVSKLLKQHS